MNEIALFEAIYTARALRRLKPDPVPEDVLTKVIDAAIRAPSAGNAQSWTFLVVRDREQRARLGAIYRKASDIASVMYANRARPTHMSDVQYRRFMSSGAYLWDHMADAPVLLIPCMKHPSLQPKSALPPEIAGLAMSRSAPTRIASAAPVSTRRSRTLFSHAAPWAWRR